MSRGTFGICKHTRQLLVRVVGRIITAMQPSVDQRRIERTIFDNKPSNAEIQFRSARCIALHHGAQRGVAAISSKQQIVIDAFDLPLTVIGHEERLNPGDIFRAEANVALASLFPGTKLSIPSRFTGPR